MQLIIHVGGVRRHFYIRRLYNATGNWVEGFSPRCDGILRGSAFLRPFASHLIFFSAKQPLIFADFAAECAGIASVG